MTKSKQLIESVINEASPVAYKRAAKGFVHEFMHLIKDGDDIELEVSDWATANLLEEEILMQYVLMEIKKRGIRY